MNIDKINFDARWHQPKIPIAAVIRGSYVIRVGAAGVRRWLAGNAIVPGLCWKNSRFAL